MNERLQCRALRKSLLTGLLNTSYIAVLCLSLIWSLTIKETQISIQRSVSLQHPRILQCKPAWSGLNLFETVATKRENWVKRLHANFQETHFHCELCARCFSFWLPPSCEVYMVAIPLLYGNMQTAC